VTGPIDRFDGQHLFLSNFSPDGFALSGDVWQTGEHAFQGHKTTDRAARDRIGRASSALQAKHMGREVVLRPDWDQVRKRVMNEVVFAKFGQNPHIRGLLVATGERLLVEGNTWHDNDWGDCRCADPRRAGCREHGRNWLGRILMHARFIFQEDGSTR
jgi:ribA/ribD-fused uncharacterized protein